MPRSEEQQSEGKRNYVSLVRQDLLRALFEGEVEEVAETLDTIARDSSEIVIPDTEIKENGKFARGDETEFVSFRGIEFGGVSVGNFFDRELTEQEILNFLRNLDVTQSHGIPRGAALISSLLCMPLEDAELSTEDLDDSRYLYANITTFRDFVYEVFQTGRIQHFLSIMRSLPEPDTMKLGLSLGRWFRDDLSLVLRPLKDAATRPKYQRVSDQIWSTFSYAQRGNFIREDGTGVVDVYVEQVSCAETVGSEERAREAHHLINEAFNENFMDIYDAITKVGHVEIPCGESLYLSRLGIEYLRFQGDQDSGEPMLFCFVNLKNGMLFGFGFGENDDLEERLEEMRANSGLSDKRGFEFMAYTKGLMVDLLRYSRGRKKLKRRRMVADVLEIPRHLLSSSGIHAPLEIRQGMMVVGEEPRFVTADETSGTVTRGRHMVWRQDAQMIDLVDRLTGEVRRVEAVPSRYYPIVTLSTRARLGKEPMTVNFDHDGAEAFAIETVSLLPFEQFAKRHMRVLSDISCTAALEYVLLYFL